MGKINYCNLANNHILDYKEEGLFDTIDVLDELKIYHTGAGKNIKEARKPVIINIQGINLGILSASDHPKEWMATDITPGIWYLDLNSQESLNEVITEIKLLKDKEVDVILFSIHHGSNYVDKIPKSTKLFFHQIIRAGVNIIAGHSAHHLLPVEKKEMEGRCSLIFYSLGDFIDDYAIDNYYRNDIGMLAKIDIKKSKGKMNCKLQLMKTLITNMIVNSMK